MWWLILHVQFVRKSGQLFHIQEEVLAQVAKELGQHAALKKMPNTLHTLKLILVATGNNGLEGKSGRSLQNGKIRTCLGAFFAIGHMNDGVGNKVLRARRAFFVQARRAPIHLKYGFATAGTLLHTGRQDLRMGKQIRDPATITSINALCIEISRFSISPR